MRGFGVLASAIPLAGLAGSAFSPPRLCRASPPLPSEFEGVAVTDAHNLACDVCMGGKREQEQVQAKAYSCHLNSGVMDEAATGEVEQ